MANMTNYLENKLVDHIFRGATFAKPSALYVGLLTSAPSDTGGGTEVSGGGYARVLVGPGDTAWTATQGGTSGNSSGTSGLTENAADITFPAPSANWGTIVGYAIFDASSGGNMLIYGSLSVSKAVNSGDAAPKFLAGALDVIFD